MRVYTYIPAIFLLVLHFSLPTSAFFPTDLRENLVGRYGISHESQTRWTFGYLAEEFFGILTLSKSMEAAQKTINVANQRVDKDQKHAHKHFDGESFNAGQQRLLKLRDQVRANLTQLKPVEARKALGEALHTLQDFYSHSNYIEAQSALGANPVLPYPGLGSPAGSINGIASSNTSTCGDCSDDPSDIYCLDCHNNVGITFLTSGYYHGEDIQPPVGVRKCNHGGSLDGSVNQPETPSPKRMGINKDSFACLWSPHAFEHSLAAAVSQVATQQYYRDLDLTKDQLRLLFGIGPSLAFAVDTTGSMGDVIAAVRDQLIKIVDSRTATDTPIAAIPNLYVLAPFNDPADLAAQSTTDADAFKSMLEDLTASGGGDCPEKSMGGLLAAMDKLDDGADLFLITDAGAKDSSRKSEVIGQAQKKRIKIHAFIFAGDCSQDDTYQEITTATGGGYFALQSTDAGSIILLADVYTKPHAQTIFELKKISTSTSKKRRDSSSTHEIPVDSGMVSLVVSFDGSGNLTLTRPDGSIVQPTDTGVTQVNLEEGTMISVDSPTSGTWLASLTGNGNQTLSVTGESPLHFADFSLVESAGRDGHDGYFPIESDIPLGSTVNLTATLTGNFTTASFQVCDLSGAVLQEVSMQQGDGVDGGVPTNQFFGQIGISDRSHRIVAKGLDISGSLYQRYLPIPAGNGSLDALVTSNSTANSTSPTANNTAPYANATATITSSSFNVSASTTVTSTTVATNTTVTTSSSFTKNGPNDGWEDWSTGLPEPTGAMPELLGSGFHDIDHCTMEPGKSGSADSPPGSWSSAQYPTTAATSSSVSRPSSAPANSASTSSSSSNNSATPASAATGNVQMSSGSAVATTAGGQWPSSSLDSGPSASPPAATPAQSSGGPNTNSWNATSQITPFTGGTTVNAAMSLFTVVLKLSFSITIGVTGGRIIGV